MEYTISRPRNKVVIHFTRIMSIIVCLLAVTVLANTVVDTTMDKFKQQILAAKTDSTLDKTKQLECLARNIYWEAAQESFEGKVAVAQVTMNRAASSKFASSICGVVYEKNYVYNKTVCQFSWVCEPGKPRKVVDSARLAESMEVAKKVYLENFRLPSLKTAMYYHADYVSPGWKKKQIAKIGRHIFYED